MKTTFDKSINNGIIKTNDDCRGCNKCLKHCPVHSANVALDMDGSNHIYVDQTRCILCGRCISTCMHDARDFDDDTNHFFSDLNAVNDGRKKKGISLLVAPAFRINYPKRYKMILGYLKSLGINHIYSVSFGADISVWGYLNYLNETGKTGMISQPCPTIVKYIEMYRPALLEKLIPVQSPVMCTAIYLKNYLNLEDDLAFLSPCIAKKSEFERPQNEGLIRYNVTFDKLMNLIDGVDISMFEAEDSEIQYGMGAIFSKHGGLRQNVEYYLGLDSSHYISQKDGENYSYSYLDQYAGTVESDDPYRAELVDIINCARGCNYGTATEFKNSPATHIPYSANNMRVQKVHEPFPETTEVLKTPKERLAALNKRFESLTLSDFITSYSDESLNDPPVTSKRINEVFKEMLKLTEAEQTINCSGCGMNSCYDMAHAIALGHNHKDNCYQYVKKKLLIEQNESSIQKQRYKLLQASKNMNIPANIDQLTGLQNRYAYEQYMEKSIQNELVGSSSGTIFMLDLDDFKSINESYGTDFGNSLLINFSQFLKLNFGEISQIFRIGGDEFALIMESCSTSEARIAVDAILHRTQEAWSIFGVRIYCTTSIGVATYPYMDESASGIMRNVESAMYAAKQKGKNNCVFYSDELLKDSLCSIELIRSMRDSISNDFEGFKAAFQPWVTVDGRVIGCEALMRWFIDDRYISPAEFIPVAEQTGLIVPLGEFILREAANACREINEFHPNFTISINVSAKQMEHNEMYEHFNQILEQSGVNRKNIVLEITESVPLEDSEANQNLLKRLIETGVSIGLDDFGTGYSSLSYLNEFPFDLIKMDRAFIKDITEDNYQGHLLTMITDLMHKMDRRIVVEGVEEALQLEFCADKNVDIIQGYYYYKPMFLDDLKKLLDC